MGGKVYNFNTEDKFNRSQHYDWLLPVFYRSSQSGADDVRCMYLEARTTTVQRSIVPNVEEHLFGEVPVLNRVTAEILLKNIGRKEETLRMEPLTPFGGFSVLNAMRSISPGETLAIVVEFIPES
jgi:hypothetical protein